MRAYFIGGCRDLSCAIVSDDPVSVYDVPRVCPPMVMPTTDKPRPIQDGEVLRVYYERYRLYRLPDPTTGDYIAVYVYDDASSGHPYEYEALRPRRHR